MKTKPKPKDSSNTRLIRALTIENTRLKKQLTHLNNDVGVQMNSLKAIAKTVDFPSNRTLERLPKWVEYYCYWPTGDVGVQTTSLKAIAKTVGFPANETLEHLPMWVKDHWPSSEIVIN